MNFFMVTHSNLSDNLNKWGLCRHTPGFLQLDLCIKELMSRTNVNAAGSRFQWRTFRSRAS
jgi:hypothetical protein